MIEGLKIASETNLHWRASRLQVLWIVQCSHASSKEEHKYFNNFSNIGAMNWNKFFIFGIPVLIQDGWASTGRRPSWRSRKSWTALRWLDISAIGFAVSGGWLFFCIQVLRSTLRTPLWNFCSNNTVYWIHYSHQPEFYISPSAGCIVVLSFGLLRNFWLLHLQLNPSLDGSFILEVLDTS